VTGSGGIGRTDGGATGGTGGRSDANTTANGGSDGGADRAVGPDLRGTGGTPGIDGGGGSEPCTPAATIAGTTGSGNSGNFGTAGAYCFRTSDSISGWGCSNFDGRTLKVNGVAKDCAALPLPAKVNGYYYFDCSAGTYNYASIYWY
jgi:hypothetical protein